MADDDVKSTDTPRVSDGRGGEVEDRRVAEIVELKMNFAWRGMAAVKAQEWGLSVGYVNNLAVKANKVVRRCAADPDEVAAELLPGLIKSFRSSVDAVTDATDAHAQAKAMAGVASIGKVLVDIAGLEAPKTSKTELTGKDGGPVQVVGPVIFTPAESDD